MIGRSTLVKALVALTLFLGLTLSAPTAYRSPRALSKRGSDSELSEHSAGSSLDPHTLHEIKLGDKGEYHMQLGDEQMLGSGAGATMVWKCKNRVPSHNFDLVAKLFHRSNNMDEIERENRVKEVAALKKRGDWVWSGWVNDGKDFWILMRYHTGVHIEKSAAFKAVEKNHAECVKFATHVHGEIKKKADMDFAHHKIFPPDLSKPNVLVPATGPIMAEHINIVDYGFAEDEGVEPEGDMKYHGLDEFLPENLCKKRERSPTPEEAAAAAHPKKKHRHSKSPSASPPPAL